MNNFLQADSNRNKLTLTCILFIYALAFIMQTQLLINPDLSWLLHATKRWLAGGTYTTQFFETNPPFILFLTAPVVLFANGFHLSPILLMKVYVFTLISLSLGLCSLIVKRNSILIISIAFALLILPLYEFGQREHLLIILTLPYFLYIYLRLYQPEEVNRKLSIIVGLLASVGFAIKPFFLLPFALTEFYFCIVKKDRFGWVRIESITILLISIFYFLCISIFFQDYIQIIIPLMTRYYYQGLGLSWLTVLSYPALIFCSLTIPLFFFYKNNLYQKLTQVLIIPFIGFILLFILQRTLLYYHLLPAFILAFVIFTLFFSSALKETTNFSIFIFYSLLLLSFIYFFYSTIWTILVFHPVWYFIFFLSLFSLVFFTSQANKNIYLIFLKVLFIGVLGYLFLSAYPNDFQAWKAKRFIVTSLLLFLLFFLMLPDNFQNKTRYFLVTLLGATLFIYPFFSLNYLYSNALATHMQLKQLAEFIKTKAEQQNVFIMAFTPLYSFPIVDLANVNFASKIPFFWMLPGIVKNSNPEQNVRDKNFIIDIMVEDIIKNKPQLILIDANTKIEHVKFNFLNYFSSNLHFQTVFKNYRYLFTIKQKQFSGYYFYQFDVYQRIQS